MNCPGRAALCLFLGCLGGAGCAPRNQTETVWVGHVADLSGPGRAGGEQARNGIRLATDEVNKDGVLPGKVVAVYHADTRGEPDLVRSVVTRLLTVNRVMALLGGPETARAEQRSARATAAAVPFLLAAGSAGRPLNEYTFTTGLGPDWQGQLLGRTAAQELKPGPVALVTGEEPDQSAAADAFARELPKETAVGRWTVTVKDGWKAVAEEVRAKKPQAVFFAGAAEDLVAWARAGWPGQAPVFFAGDEASASVLSAVAGPAAVYRATAFVPDAETPAAQEFVKAYQERFGNTPDARAALAYDDARLLFEAMRKAKAVEGEKVRDALRGLELESLTGPLTLGKETQAAERAGFVIRRADGQTKTLRRYPPEGKGTQAGGGS